MWGSCYCKIFDIRLRAVNGGALFSSASSPSTPARVPGGPTMTTCLRTLCRVIPLRLIAALLALRLTPAQAASPSGDKPERAPAAGQEDEPVRGVAFLEEPTALM